LRDHRAAFHSAKSESETTREKGFFYFV